VTASTDAADRTLHLLLQALEAGGVPGQVLALVLDDRGLRAARVNSWRLARARRDGVEGGAALSLASRRVGVSRRASRASRPTPAPPPEQVQGQLQHCVRAICFNFNNF